MALCPPSSSPPRHRVNLDSNPSKGQNCWVKPHIAMAMWSGRNPFFIDRRWRCSWSECRARGGDIRRERERGGGGGGGGDLRETSDSKENQADSTQAPELGAEDTEIDDVQTWWCCLLQRLITLLSLLV